MKIKIGTLRKIIKEELVRAKNLHEAKPGIALGDPYFRGGSMQTVGAKTSSKEPDLSQFMVDYEIDLGDEFADDLVKEWMTANGMKFEDEFGSREFKFVKSTSGDLELMGLIGGNDVSKVVKTGPKKYSTVPVATAPESMAARARYA